MLLLAMCARIILMMARTLARLHSFSPPSTGHMRRIHGTADSTLTSMMHDAHPARLPDSSWFMVHKGCTEIMFTRRL